MGGKEKQEYVNNILQKDRRQGELNEKNQEKSSRKAKLFS